jgi:hypothetical protein
MQIGIQLQGEQCVEVSLTLEEATGLWVLTTGKGSPVHSNAAGLVTAFEMLRNRAETSPEQAARERKRCALGMPWQCPHPDFPCLRVRYRKNWKHLARIGLSDYQSRFVPVGQMSLFEPNVTHRRVWKHVSTGAIREQPEQPISQVMVVCKQMAVATVEWLKRQQGWDPVVWKIRPLDAHHKCGRQWTEMMATRYPDRLPACTFYDL